MMSSRGFPITKNDRLFVAGVLLFLVGVFITGVIVGKEYQTTRQTVYRAQDSQIAVFSDPLTGCQYLSTTSGASFVPRLDRNGSHICIAKHETREN